MNHFQLFLNASTQMIFIVYASLSVLRVFRASTFPKGWHSGQGRGSGRATLPRALRANERSRFTPVGEQHHGGPGSPRTHLQLLQTMLFTSRGCYGGAQTQKLLRKHWTDHRSLEELILIQDCSTGRTRLFWMQIVSVFHRDACSHQSMFTCTYKPSRFRILQPTIRSYPSRPWLKGLFQQGIPYSCTILLYVTGFFFFWLWEDTTKAEYNTHGGVLCLF